MDKPGSLDIWFYYFIKEKIKYTPKWYWYSLAGKGKNKSILKKEEKEFIMNFYDLSESDIEYLEKYHLDELKIEVKKFKKFNK
jgi:hypothetical protein